MKSVLQTKNVVDTSQSFYLVILEEWDEGWNGIRER